MVDLWQRLKRRKLVQWVVAYVAGAWALLQVLDLAAGSYHWPDLVMHVAFGALALGLVVTLLLAWYHGERGAQKVTGVELLLLAGVFAIGGFLIWHYAGNGSPATSALHAPASAVAASTPMPKPSPATSIPAKSIAVLPFENLSSDKDNGYFADGMQDLILTKLADIGGLRVISRTSTLKYASHPDDLKTVGRQLGVATVLEGSVQKAGDQVLINVQLIDTRSDSHLWAESYQRTLDNIFGVEGDVAGKIADALKATLTPSEARAVASIPTRVPAAYDAYLLGQHYEGQMEAGHWEQAAQAAAAYRHATEADPSFALAWARLGYIQAILRYAGIDASDATRQQALANARHALRLAPDLPQAHFALGYVYRIDFADYDKAMAEFRLARRGLPNDAEVEAAIAYLEIINGRVRKALVGLQRAVVLDPRNPGATYSLGRVYSNLRRYDDAEGAFQRALAIAPDDPEVYAAQSSLQLLWHGDVRAAMHRLDQAPRALQSNPAIVMQRVINLIMARDYTAARREAAHLKGKNRFVKPLDVLVRRADIERFAGNPTQAHALDRRILAMVAPALNGPPTEETLDALASMAVAQASLGRRADALHTLSRMDALTAKSLGSHASGSIYALATANTRAKVDVRTGQPDDAIHRLGPLLAAPVGGHISVPLLRIDPFWDSLRKQPAFQTLLKQYADDKPARLPTEAGSD